MNGVMGMNSFALGRVVVVGVALMLLSGCAASQVMISKRNLDVQTKMSDTIFLDPVSPDKKVMYVQ
ncbi:MAG: complement resistance protein TraT, partial [Nitrospira sp.]|nr:complement resistance protein TraT [Nitrospira sp.]